MYSDEYFAECFALYFNSSESKEMLKAHAPMTYKYIDKIIKD
jgi:PhoPQ-activated pathogenicity-related protein